MIIKELHLINFGKFTNKKIELDSKMNIIYGENEAGKSTIFQFIVAMFYGFYKPYVKNRRLLELYDMYKPWNGGGYNGSLLFYDELTNQDLRVERDFTQGQESIKVFIEKTGQDITQSYDVHPIYRLPDIASKHIGVSYASFVNTLAIKQLGHETDENLEKEIKETVVNALSTHNIDVSVHKVQDKILKELDAIGSSRRKASAYSIKKQKIEELTSELDKSMEIHQKMISFKDQIEDLNRDKHSNEEKLEQVRIIEKYSLYNDKKEIIKQASQMHKSIINLQDKQKVLNISNEFTINEIENAIEDYSRSEFISKQLEENKKNKDEIEKEISLLKSDLNKPKSAIDDEDLEKITKDIYVCNQLNEECNDLNKGLLLLANNQEEISRHIGDVSKKDNKGQKNLSLGLMTALVSFLILIVSIIFLYKTSMLIIGLIIGLIGLLIGGGLYLTSKHKVALTKDEVKQLLVEEQKKEDRIKSQKALLEAKSAQVSKLLQTYKVEDIPSLTWLKDRWLKESMAEASISKIYESQLKSLEKLRNREKLLLESVEEQKHRLSNLENRLRPITSYYYITNIEELKNVKQRLSEYMSLAKNIEHEQLRLKDLLKGQSLEEAEKDLDLEYQKFKEDVKSLKEVSLVQDEADESSLVQDEADESSLVQDEVKKVSLSVYEQWLLGREAKLLLQAKPDINRSINDLNQSIAGIKSKSQALALGHRRVSEVEEELVTEKEQLETLEFNKKVYETISETIKNITDELQHNFAPLLNESVSNMVSTITDHKYKDIKINPQMIMKLKDPKSHKMINATQLSRGTMDLFYLALRDALATWINENKKLPVLLDETFAHFDDLRLDAALHLFSRSPRQVILFTCQKREVEISQKLDMARVISL